MTSTNVFCGISDEKNSSKVLRPPGGGHTDIFGAAEPPVKKDMGRNASSILEGTRNNIIPSGSPAKTSQPPQKSAAPPPAETAAPNRSRVPPGGFSSGPLW